MVIIIIGYSGSSKISIAKKISKKLNLKFFDLHNKIEEYEMLSVPEIINSKGNVFFRKIEHKFLKQIINDNKGLVLSVNEGTPCYSNNIKYIINNNIESIYLKYSVVDQLDHL